MDTTQVIAVVQRLIDDKEEIIGDPAAFRKGAHLVRDVQMDSLSIVCLTGYLETEFGVTIKDPETWDWVTADDVIDCILRKTQSSTESHETVAEETSCMVPAASPSETKRVLVIGGTKGIGLATKKALLAAGHQVLALSRQTEPPLDLMWTQERITDVVRQEIENLGGLDALVVSAGMGAYLNPIAAEQEILDLTRTNFVGPVLCYQAALPSLIRSRGKAIFISSTASRKPGSGPLSVYGATKAAVNSYVSSESRRSIKRGVALCAVSPGWVETPMVREMKTELRDATTRAIPARRYGQPEEIALFVRDLLNQSNWVIAGSTYECSGGA